MQGKQRAIIALGGFGVLTVVLLLLSASLVGSFLLTLISGLISIVVIGLGCILALKMATKFSKILSELSSRIRSMERRMGQQDFSALEESLDPLLTRVVAIESTQKSSTDHIDGIRRQLKLLRNRVPAGYMQPIQEDLATLKDEGQALLRTTFELALNLNRDPKAVLTVGQARELFEDYLLKEQYLQLRPLIEHFNLLEEQSLSTLRLLYRFFRRTGYWGLASKVIQQLHALSNLDSDGFASLKLKHEIEVFSQPTSVTVALPDGSGYDPAGPILHMVGRVLPETQTGYTLRTQYTARAQARAGLPVAIIGQTGITSHTAGDFVTYKYQGIDYYLLPGPARNEVFLDEWLRSNISELARLVEEIRPSILHAQSDFFNALIVSVVGKQYGIPTVYESRGFWEYSWLSRTITANNWSDVQTLFAMYGTPAAYEYRRNAEIIARTLPDHVFTLAEVMKEHILESGRDEIDSARVSIVPNAVEADNFPLQDPDHSLADKIGLPSDAVVVGYISSMVEYEGIDTLIDGFRLASEGSAGPLCLLLVGDGDYLPTLKEQVANLEISNVYFTGRVPHEEVLHYYGLIDVFVVPRKKSTVADLVTPLKPFEAFATGRAVILSDVGALREIAQQSKAVEMFRAGDSEDLAKKITELAETPSKRKDLSKRAARWVRNYRSWDNNVNEYYRVYKKLGYAGPRNLLIESALELLDREMNPGELVEALSKADLPQLQGWFTIQETKQSATSIIEEGWRFASFEPVMVSQLHDWARYGAEHRSWGFHLHAWEFMDPLLQEYAGTGNVEWLDVGIKIALNWIEPHCVPGDTTDPMVWYDMSLALRLPRLIALALRAAKFEKYRDETIILAAAIARHLDELQLDRAFNPNNNHGFYTAISQVHACKYVPMFAESRASGRVGNQRLARVAKFQFAQDGTHLEHSPEYHRMLLNSFEYAVGDSLIMDEEVKNRVERAAHVLGWMVQPDGTLVQFGDSPERKVVNQQANSIDKETQFILSDGEYGVKPDQELGVFADGGYAFVRSPQPKDAGSLHRSGYLAFSAAFHSRAHKHADDLNVVWYDAGQQILTDSGRFGYGELLTGESPLRRDGFYYVAPERQYVEGTMAHNTLMMDGDNHERRARKPYGSGIVKCLEADGVFDLTGRVQHQDYVHRRRVVYRPGIELLLKDSIYSQSPEPREAIIWLNISGHFSLEGCDEELVFSSYLNDKRTLLCIEGPGRLIEPVKGQEEPFRGWRSREDLSIEPTWSIGFAFTVETRTSVRTRLQLRD